MTNRRTERSAGLALYSHAAQHSTAEVMKEYSTSFGLATRLLSRQIRPDIKNIYGLVRIADEIVDGAAAEAGLDLQSLRHTLDALETETGAALETGYSTNIVVHSFSLTARVAGIGTALTDPFFASMRRDLDPADFTADEVREYIYGSAEVIGLMCLKVFLKGVPCHDSQRQRLEEGARRLGSAFQKINFLRDLGTDWNELGRNYFPGIDPTHLTEAQKLKLVADIDADLLVAAAVIPELPRNCRAAVDTAHGLFAALTQRIRETPAQLLIQTRIRVPNALKMRIALQAQARCRIWGAR
ncbi:MAG: squalene/phytoene synthase family protein [Microbacteriaceae bacterium]